MGTSAFYFVAKKIWRCKIISKEELRINEEIRCREVRLVGEEGEQLGIMSPKEAFKLAVAKGLDLVEVAPSARPPVCKIMDHGKFKYEQSKREREARKKQRVINVKEVKLRPNIEDHDFDVKTKNALRFLEDGDKVKVTIMFRGREVSHSELGRELLKKVAVRLDEYAIVEKGAKLEGRNMTMFLSPKQS
ncbi:MAG: translation initiation factor IF-3 [Clostridia bacterium]|nr:translation initiation factor IF-3 [Clostridia bacterium]MDD4048085.1 translation initiation factor IF-3 [Clostridia bacterium]